MFLSNVFAIKLNYCVACDPISSNRFAPLLMPLPYLHKCHANEHQFVSSHFQILEKKMFKIYNLMPPKRFCFVDQLV